MKIYIISQGKRLDYFQNNFFFPNDRLDKIGLWKIRHPENQLTMAQIALFSKHVKLSSQTEWNVDLYQVTVYIGFSWALMLAEHLET